MKQPIELIRACTADTSILRSTLAWFETERDSVLNQLADKKEQDEIYRLQGEARCLRRLGKLLPQWTTAKGQVVDEQPRVRAVR